MRYFIHTLLLLVIGTALAAQSPFRITDGQKAEIGEYIAVLLDTTGQLGPVALGARADFAPNPTAVVNLGPTPATAWLRFTLEKTVDRDVFLEISEPNLETIELYAIIDGSPRPLYRGGFTEKFKDRPIEHNRWIFDLDLPLETPRTYLLKAQSGYPLKLPISVYSDRYFIVENARSNLAWGLYGGIMAFAFFYNLFLYFSLRERIYLYYSLYVLMGSAFYLGLQGYNFQYLWPDWPALNAYLPVLVCLMNLFVFLFTLRFLNLTRAQRLPYYAGWVCVGVYLLAAGINLTGNYGTAILIAQLMGLVMSIYYIALVIWALRRKVPNAQYFAVAWLQFIALTIIFILTDTNVLPANQFTIHSLFIGHALEVILLSYALAARINFLRRDNADKQGQIIQQLEEKEQIQQRANEVLEQKVTQRTQEVTEQRNQAVKERNRSDELLLNILPEETARELKQTGSAQAKSFDNVSVLFADMANFTAKSERMSPEALVDEINEIFTAFDRIVERYGIEKIKTIGDSYMAAAGLPTPDDLSALRAVNVAIEMQGMMQTRFQGRQAAGLDSFQIRLGIHSGPVVAGVVGTKKFAYDIWGFTVNVASRMEKTGAVDRINISEATYQLVKDHFNCTFRGEQKVKGVGLVPMYFVENTTPVPLPELVQQE